MTQCKVPLKSLGPSMQLVCTLGYHHCVLICTIFTSAQSEAARGVCSDLHIHKDVEGHNECRVVSRLPIVLCTARQTHLASDGLAQDSAI